MRNQLFTYISFWLGQIAFFIFNFLSSKVLTPIDYSIFTILLAIIMFGMRFIEIGIGDYYLLDGVKKNLQTIYLTNIFKGLLLMLFFIVSKDKIVAFYGENINSNYILFIAFIFIIEPLKNPNIYKYYKRKKLIHIAIIERLSYVISIVIGIGLMFYYKNLWVLVITYYIFFLLQLILSYSVIPPFQTSKEFINFPYLKKVLNFSFHIIAFIMISYLIRQGMDLIVPKLIGLELFAKFSFAVLIGIVPTNFIIYPLNKILYPIYTDISKSNELELSKVFNNILVQIFLLLISVALVIYFSAPYILQLLDHLKLFDHKLLGIVLLYSVIRGITAILGTVYKALDMQKKYNFILVIEASVLLPLIFIFHSDVQHIVYGMITAMLLHLMIGLIQLRKKIEFKLSKILFVCIVGVVYTIVLIFISNYHLSIVYGIILLNALLFVSLLYKLLMSLKRYFV